MAASTRTSKLIILSEQHEGQRIYQISEPVYTIGRTEDQSVCLPDSTVSTNHCKLIRNENGSYRVVDLDSSNGTRINGEEISEETLKHSDMLQVGGIEILYNSDDEAVSEDQGVDTGINIEDSAGGLQIQEMGNVNPFKKEKNNVAKAVSIAIFSVLGLIVLLFLGKLLVKMF
jgi:pSer/pThr/pTyr-binding forkhead associated (FHA) protein